MAKYFLGADLGGTKTHVLIADERGQALGFGRSGPGNHEVVGYDGLAHALQEAAGPALAQAGITVAEIAGAGFGVAGYDWPAEREPTIAAIRRLGLAAPFEIVNDAVIGLLAGASRGWGIAIVAGTGNNCWGWDAQHRVGHVTGCGDWMGEAGGGYDLVLDGIRAVSRQWSCRGPATRLTEAFIHSVGARDLDDLIEGLNLGRYEIDASAAPLVFRVAAAGDPLAQAAVRKNGRDLADLAVGVIRQLEFEALEFEVVLVGSIYAGSPLLIEELECTIHAVAPGAHLVRLDAPPVVGGVLLGMEEAGLIPQPVRETLIHSTRRWLEAEPEIP